MINRRKPLNPRVIQAIICKGPHCAKDCPKREKLNGLVAKEEIEESTRVNPLQLLNAIRHKWSGRSRLMYVQACFNGILVVVDCFSKYGTFISAPHACIAEVAAKLFFQNVVKPWGIPEDIVSDRDARFTGSFWTYLFELLGMQLHFSTSNHPQSDGQTERVNAMLEEYLRHYVIANQKSWVDLLAIAVTICRVPLQVQAHSSWQLANNLLLHMK